MAQPEEGVAEGALVSLSSVNEHRGLNVDIVNRPATRVFIILLTYNF